MRAPNQSLSLKVKYAGEQFTPAGIGTFTDDPDRPLLAIKHFQDNVENKDRLEHAWIEDEDGHVVRVIL